MGEGGLKDLCKKFVIAREFLLEIDTPLAIATLGLKMNLLLQEHPFPNTPHLIFPRSAIRVDT